MSEQSARKGRKERTFGIWDGWVVAGWMDDSIETTQVLNIEIIPIPCEKIETQVK